MSALLLYLIPVGAALAQLTWMPRLGGSVGYPELAVVAVAAWTWTRGPREGLWWAIVAGIVLDLGSTGPLGPHALALVVAAYAAGIVLSTVHGGLLVLSAASGIATVVYGAALLVAAALLREAPLQLHANAGWIAWTAAWDAVLAPVAVLAVRRAERGLAALRY